MKNLVVFQQSLRNRVRTILCSLPLVLIAIASSYGQGRISVNNTIPARVFMPDGTTLITGTWLMHLMAGPTPESLATCAISVRWDNEEPGALSAIGGIVPGVPPGSAGYAKIRIFNHSLGGDYATALANGAIHGDSEVVPFTPGTESQPALLSHLPSFILRNPDYAAFRFENFVPGLIDAPVFDAAGVPLSGTSYVAQVYAQLLTNRFTTPFVLFPDPLPVGSPAPFGTGVQAGYWQPGADSIRWVTNIAAGNLSRFQVKVWDRSMAATYEEAVLSGADRGESEILQMVPGSVTAPSYLTNLTSFRLISSQPGRILFRNPVPGIIDSPVLGSNGERLAFPYVVQVLVNGQVVAAPAPFGTGTQSGYWISTGDGVVIASNVLAGELATVELHAWDGAAFPSYEEALAEGVVLTSGSKELRVGGGTLPPATLQALGASGIQMAVLTTGRSVGIIFRNFIPGVLDAPVMTPDGARLSGSNYVAQLYQGWLSTLTPLGEPAPFGTGSTAGYWQPEGAIIHLVNLPAGCCLNVEVRIWDRTHGDTYEQAVNGLRAVSTPLSLRRRYNLLTGLSPYFFFRGSDPMIGIVQPVRTPFIVGLDRQPLSDPAYLGQLYFSRTSERQTFVPVGQPASVGLIGEPGQWDVPSGTTLPFPGFPPGESAYVELRIWEANRGGSFEIAEAGGSVTGITTPPIPISIPNTPHSGPTLVVVNPAIRSIRLNGIVHTVTAPPGFSLVNNPFDQSEHLFLQAIAPSVPEGTVLYVFNSVSQSYDIITYDLGVWLPTSYLIPAGAGFWVRNPGARSISFSFRGVSRNPVLIGARPGGRAEFHAIGGTQSAPIPLANSLAFPLVDGDTVYRYVAGAWSITSYEDGVWSGFTPELVQGEGLFLRLQPEP